MRKKLLRFLVNTILFWVALTGVPQSELRAVTPLREEVDQAGTWVQANFPKSWPAAEHPPFAFVYNGRPSSKLLKGWRLSVGPEVRSGQVNQQYLFILTP